MTSRRTARRAWRVIEWTAAATVIACGGGADAPTSTSAGSLVLTPPSATIHSLDRQQLAAALPDGTSATSVVWATSNPHVAQVSAGVVTGYAEGSAVITATSGSRSATVTVTVPPDAVLGEFIAPLASDQPTLNVFDHSLPHEFDPVTANGFLLSYWGERFVGIDGHNGYDWSVSTGTSVVASAAGRVISAGTETPFACSLLNNAVVAGMWVTIVHGVQPGEMIETMYGHLSRIDVKVGDAVSAGQQIGLSGNTGCSTQSHLHFSALRLRGGEQTPRVMDPFGWTATSADPWAADTGGVASVAIWTAAHAPKLFGERRNVGVFTAGFAIAFPTIRYWGMNDATSPNNEFIDVQANPQNAAALDIGGWKLVNNTGDTYVFAAGMRVSPGATLRLYTGAGTPTATTLYWGRAAGVWNNDKDCVELLDSSGKLMFNAQWNMIC